MFDIVFFLKWVIELTVVVICTLALSLQLFLSVIKTSHCHLSSCFGSSSPGQLSWESPHWGPWGSWTPGCGWSCWCPCWHRAWPLSHMHLFTHPVNIHILLDPLLDFLSLKDSVLESHHDRDDIMVGTGFDCIGVIDDSVRNICPTVIDCRIGLPDPWSCDPSDELTEPNHLHLGPGHVNYPGYVGLGLGPERGLIGSTKTEF